MAEVAYKLCWGDTEGKRTLCKDWDTCGGHSWYELKDIQYCRYQVIFLLSLIDFINDEYVTVSSWPDDPHKLETGYDDVRIQTSTPNHANFEPVLQITGELINRIQRTGKDGRLLLLESRTRDNYKEFSQEARNALYYCCGWARKRQGYRQWLADRSRNHRKYGETKQPLDKYV